MLVHFEEDPGLLNYEFALVSFVSHLLYIHVWPDPISYIQQSLKRPALHRNLLNQETKLGDQ